MNTVLVKRYAYLQIQDITASDNTAVTAFNFTVVGGGNFTFSAPVIENATVIYTATDQAGNSAQCTLQVEIIGNET